MKKELDDALVRDFPHLYKDRNAPMNVTCMCWGFPGDGWEPIIRKLSEKLTELINHLPKEYYYAVQVKEKFASLRFYMSATTEEMLDVIDEAEKESLKTCEYCGKPGEMRSDKFWLKTLCDECHEKRNNGTLRKIE